MIGGRARMAMVVVATGAIVATAPAVRAQEPALDQFFEGKQVVVLIDMPGSQQGVDLYPDRPNSLDANNYGKRMKSFPVALRVGDSVMVTKVKVSGKRIEFQLGGGGFGTAGDATDTAVHFTPAEKSQREKDLENQIANTDDPDQKRYLQRQLDDVVRQRERDDRRNKQIAEDDAARRQQQVIAHRMTGGSRFNLNYNDKVPADMTPHAVMLALSKYVSFPVAIFGDQNITNQNPPGAQNAGAAPGSAPARGNSPSTIAAANAGSPAYNGGAAPPTTAASAPSANPLHSLQKGMKVEDVQTLLGAPTSQTDADHDGIQVHTEIFERPDATVTCSFVSGVLVSYNIAVH
ncbi:MAG: hypothetical protein WA823_08425 [Candidatus Acidiferrales bacterium]